MLKMWIPEPDIHSMKAVENKLFPGEYAIAMTWRFLAANWSSAGMLMEVSSFS